MRQLVVTGLLSEASILDDGLVLHCSWRRNHGVRVDVGGEPILFVKRTARPAGPRQEASNIRALARAGLSAILPVILDEGVSVGTMVLKYAPGVDLRAYHHEHWGQTTSVAHALGIALGRLHVLDYRSVGGKLPVLDGRVLRLMDDPTTAIADLGPGERNVLAIVGGDRALADLAAHAGDMWSPRCVIHGDLRWDNAIASRAEASTVMLVDWEHAGIGDPAWDLAMCFSDYVAAWIAASREASDSEVSIAAPCALGDVHSAIGAMLSGYASSGAIVNPGDIERLPYYVAVRLVHSALELSAGYERCPRLGVLQLQLASNVARNPRTAFLDLFGILGSS